MGNRQTHLNIVEAFEIAKEYMQSKYARRAVYQKDANERKVKFAQKLDDLTAKHYELFNEQEKPFLVAHEKELSMLDQPETAEGKIRYNLEVVIIKRQYDAQRKARMALVPSEELLQKKAAMKAEFNANEAEITAAQTELGKVYYDNAFDAWRSIVEGDTWRSIEESDDTYIGHLTVIWVCELHKAIKIIKKGM
jgi:hypothetical protein